MIANVIQLLNISQNQIDWNEFDYYLNNIAIWEIKN
jgi:hypothetical protein